MKASKATYFSLGAVLAVALLATTLSFSLAPSTDAAGFECEACPPGQPNQTPYVWGIGSTCGEAEADAAGQSFIFARNSCGCAQEVCNFEMVYFQCWWNSQNQRYQITAYGVYDCRSCDSGPPVP